MKMINNEIVDSIFAIQRFANRNKQLENNYPGIPELAEWCREYEKKLSPFLLNDISLMFEKMVFPSIFLFKLYTTIPGLATVDEFLRKLKQIEPDEFLDFFQRVLLGGKKTELTIEVLLNILVEDGLHPGYDASEEAELLYVFLKDAEKFLDRLLVTYSDFYEQAYRSGKIAMKKIETEKFNWHQKRLDEGIDTYLEQLGLRSFLSSLSGEEDPIVYFSLFSDTAISSFWNIQTVIIGAGTDQRIINRSAREKADDFFSCFGDPKRLEILRLTAIRPWYSTELANHFKVKPATLSYHINILVDAELLHIVKGESRRFYYTLNKEAIKEYLKFVARDLLGPDYRD